MVRLIYNIYHTIDMVMQKVAEWTFKAIQTKKDFNTWIISIPAAVAKEWNLNKDNRDISVSLLADGSLLLLPLRGQDSVQKGNDVAGAGVPDNVQSAYLYGEEK